VNVIDQNLLRPTALVGRSVFTSVPRESSLRLLRLSLAPSRPNKPTEEPP
jgi:hypothetical protein